MPPAREGGDEAVKVPDGGALAALAGLIAGALAHDTIGALVSAPGWLMAAVCALITVALVRGGKGARQNGDLVAIAGSAISGIVCGLVLPSSLAPARSSVMTHVFAQGGATALFSALEELDERPQSLLGRRIAVSGSWHPPAPPVGAAVSQRVMACCAADAVDIGFDVVPARPVRIPAGANVWVRGVVRASLRDGEIRYALMDADVRALSARSSAAR